MLRDDQMLKLAEDEKIWSEIVAVAMMGLANERVRQWYIVYLFGIPPSVGKSNHRLIEELMDEMITNKIGEGIGNSRNLSKVAASGGVPTHIAPLESCHERTLKRTEAEMGPGT